MSNETVDIFVVELSYGKVCIASVRAVEKDKTYKVVRNTQVNYLGWQYISSRLPKGENIFMNAKDAATYAARKLAEYIDREQAELNEARNQLTELYKMLGKA